MSVCCLPPLLDSAFYITYTPIFDTFKIKKCSQSRL